MELKYYGKPWMQAFKGAFFIVLGIILMLQIQGSIHSLAIFFSFFIGLTGFVLLVAPIILKKRENKGWNMLTGILNLFFAIIIVVKLEGDRIEIFWVVVIWVLFNALTELIEAIILFSKRNSFFALFLIHALLSLLLGFALYNLIIHFDSERLFNVGVVAVVFGIVNELSAFMLRTIKQPE
jgi:uncharacterized membrane protein HdeD (DUF308 family)